MLKAFWARLEAGDAVIGVVGLGYVGLPVAVTFAEAGFTVVGIDSQKERVDAIRSGSSYIADVPADRLKEVVALKRLHATKSYARLSAADAVLICVPTPLKEGAPDLSAVSAAANRLAKVLRSGSLVVLESTTYPGTTEELLRPLLETSGLAAGVDFMLAFSPERIDPGNDHYSFADIPKIVGGINGESTEAAAALYSSVIPKVVKVSGPREAEMAKLIENTYRHVNIALVNELAVYAHEINIDIWEALDAAATKPFGYMPFFPGPGWGGHCIPLDPSFLSWRVRQERAHEIRFVELAHAVNSEMHRHVVERVGELLSDGGKPLKGARIIGIGAAYKRGTEDTRQSPGLKVLHRLRRRGAHVSYHDPFVSEIELEGERFRSVHLTHRKLEESDLVIALVPQDNVDWDLIYRHASLIFDCCNVFRRRNRKVVRL